MKQVWFVATQVWFCGAITQSEAPSFIRWIVCLLIALVCLLIAITAREK